MRRLAAAFVLSAFLCGGYSVTGAQETFQLRPTTQGLMSEIALREQ